MHTTATAVTRSSSHNRKSACRGRGIEWDQAAKRIEYGRTGPNAVSSARSKRHESPCAATAGLRKLSSSRLQVVLQVIQPRPQAHPTQTGEQRMSARIDAPFGPMSASAECILMPGRPADAPFVCCPALSSLPSAFSQRSGQKRCGSGHAAASRCIRYGLMRTVVPGSQQRVQCINPWLKDTAP